MDYDWFFGLSDTTENPKPQLSTRDKALIVSALSLVQDIGFWHRAGIELNDIEWDLVEKAIAETAYRLG
jgi:hypothetical protein